MVGTTNATSVALGCMIIEHASELSRTGRSNSCRLNFLKIQEAVEVKALRLFRTTESPEPLT